MNRETRHFRTPSQRRPGFSRSGISLSSFSRPGFSLLEVILALAILAGAVAVLGEVARHGLDTARIARDLTSAQLLCETQLAEITSGLVQPDSVERTKLEAVSDPSQTGWAYSVEVESTDVEGLLAVRVTVMQDLPEERHPVRCSLVRWMQDPNATLGSGGSSSGGSSGNKTGGGSDGSTGGGSGGSTGGSSGGSTGGSPGGSTGGSPGGKPGGGK